MREASVMLIINSDGKILSVSRRKDPTKFGLPGGKVDEFNFETDIAAAIRETLEETSVVVEECSKIYTRMEYKHSDEGEDFNTHCFFATQWSGVPKDSEEGKVMWLTAAELCSTEHGAFPEYNTKTLEVFKSKYPDFKVNLE